MHLLIKVVVKELGLKGRDNLPYFDITPVQNRFFIGQHLIHPASMKTHSECWETLKTPYFRLSTALFWPKAFLWAIPFVFGQHFLLTRDLVFRYFLKSLKINELACPKRAFSGYFGQQCVDLNVDFARVVVVDMKRGKLVLSYSGKPYYFNWDTEAELVEELLSVIEIMAEKIK